MMITELASNFRPDLRMFGEPSRVYLGSTAQVFFGLMRNAPGPNEKYPRDQ